jgi:PTH1 family peptidyl-tRNA hydrolase
MVVVIGLGNPGRDYVHTRHNVGYKVADILAKKLNCTFHPGKGEFIAGFGSLRDIEIAVAKPVTSMNDSGIAVAEIIDRFGIGLDQILVVFDDFQLPFGTLRMRQSGSDGGHNGMYSIIYHLQSDAFPRLRCGIATEQVPQDKSLMADFVLSQFGKNEVPTVDDMVERAADACLSFAVDGISKAMNLHNRKIEGTD